MGDAPLGASANADQALVASDGAQEVSTLPGFDPSRLLDLAKRYERATGEDRALDADLGELIGFEVTRREPPFNTTCRRRPSVVFEDARRVVPTSLRWTVECSKPNYYAAVDRGDDPFGPVYEAVAAAPELALTAAALRARHAIAIEAATAGETPKSGSTRSAKARAGTASPESPSR